MIVKIPKKNVQREQHVANWNLEGLDAVLTTVLFVAKMELIVAHMEPNVILCMVAVFEEWWTFYFTIFSLKRKATNSLN